MRFCKVCERVMSKDFSSGSVVFVCACGSTENGDPNDARIGGVVIGVSETAEMYSKLIKNAPFDRVNQLVNRICPDCNRDYMAQIRVGSNEVFIYSCKCGYITSGVA